MESDVSLGYAGFYQRFYTVSKKESAALMGADNLIGDKYTIEFDFDGTDTTAWLVNKFNARIGYLDAETTRQLQIYHARDWEIVALLSFIAFTASPSPGSYWGECAFICYNPQKYGQYIPAFLESLGGVIQDSIRPDVTLSRDGVDQMVQNNGAWIPSLRTPLPEFPEDARILKKRRRISEKLIEKGRERNKGCYVISWLFIAVLVAALVFGIYSLVSFLGLL